MGAMTFRLLTGPSSGAIHMSLRGIGVVCASAALGTAAIVMGAAVAAAPAEMPSKATTMGAPPRVGLSLGAPRQLFRTGQLDMNFVPDQHLAVIQQPDKTYRVFITGRLGSARHGATGLLATKDFIVYAPLVGSPTHAEPVLDWSCDGVTGSCLNNFDADYAGANTVFTAANGPGCVKTLRGINAPRILRPVVARRAKKRENPSSGGPYDQIRSSFRTAWVIKSHQLFLPPRRDLLR
jgi:hypothetical protein